jgi:hypothetical protein
MDGNSSLKHVADDYRFGVVQRDERTCGDDMVLPRSEVDRFQSEKSKVSSVMFSQASTEYSIFQQRHHESGGNDLCDSRMKAAGPDAKKKMFALFEATGIFACFCRHGHMLTSCDMVRSGELYAVSFI